MKRRVEVVSDGVTVWVNDERGGNIARFGRMGIDIHHPAMEQASKSPCLHCTHAPVTAADWETFKTKLLEHHGVSVGDEYKPRRFR